MGDMIGALCAGYGGLDLAVRNLMPDAELAWVADNEPGPTAILATRFPDVPNLGDITALDWSTVPAVQILTGGTPCQDLSHAGHQKGFGSGTRSGNTWRAMCAAIDHLRPDLVVWENVRGALHAEADTDLEPCPRCMGEAQLSQPGLRALGRLLGDLAELGYDAAWELLPATAVGAPHLRYRVFLIAWPEDRRPGRSADHVLPIADDRRTDPLLMGTPAASIYRGSGGPGSPSHTARLARGYLDAQIEDLAATLLPTPVVNDMGEGKTVDWWDEWAPRQKAADGTPAVHGPSLAIEAQRLASPAWGKYAGAIARWEGVLGRPSPTPTEVGSTGRPQLAPRFVEWLMGLPAGWVTDVPDLSRRQQLQALGNGVVPLQATAAIGDLLDRIGGLTNADAPRMGASR